MPITDADREAADTLRVILADISGFWHKPGDESPLCLALARHREQAEARLAGKVVPITATRMPLREEIDFGRAPWAAAGPRRIPLQQSLGAVGDQHVD